VDRSAVLALVAASGRDLRRAHASLRNDRDVVLAAVRQSGEALRFASRRLQGDKAVVLAAVAQGGGKALAHAARPLRADKAVMLAAVRRDGLALRFAAGQAAPQAVAAAAADDAGPGADAAAPGYSASDRSASAGSATAAAADATVSAAAADDTASSLDGDVEVVLEAVAQTGEALGYASEPLRHGGLAALVRRRLAQQAGGRAVFTAIRSGGGDGGGGSGSSCSGSSGRSGLCRLGTPGGGDDDRARPAAQATQALGVTDTISGQGELKSVSTPRANLSAAVKLDQQFTKAKQDEVPPEATGDDRGRAAVAHAVPRSCRLPALGRGGEEFLLDFERDVGEYLGWRVLRAAAANLGVLEGALALPQSARLDTSNGESNLEVVGS
jgi:hypothetical protein